jgi:hypothetical protein
VNVNSITGNLAVSGNETVGGTLAVTGNTTLSGTLGVTGNTTLSGTLGVTGAQTNSSTLQATTITATSQFSGPGTGLTGTAASLTAGIARNITNSGGWSITPSGTKLYFNYNGTNIASLDSSGNFISSGNVTGYGGP